MKIENILQKYKNQRCIGFEENEAKESDWAKWYKYWVMKMPWDDWSNLADWSILQDLGDKQDAQ